jgi:uncharacterized membrane protein YphA (DoxX/SURF4 family)
MKTVAELDSTEAAELSAVEDVQAAIPPPAARWTLATRIGFRFFATYFVSYVTFTQMFSGLFGNLLALLPFNVWPPMQWQSTQKFQSYIAVKWLHFPEPLSLNRGAGDKPIDWALALGLLVIALAITLIWSVVDWKRAGYPRLFAWFRLFLRLSVATSLAGYGWSKALPTQMSFPGLTRMLEPYGHFSLMAVLWAKIGSSTPYEMFTGVAELTAAVLLLIPGLTTVGALIAIAVTFQIFMLNMTYDVPVKLFSFHLLAMSTVLLMPDLRRLFDFVVLKRAIDPQREGRLFRNLTVHRVALGLQLVFAAWLMWTGYEQGKARYARFGGAPKPELYGIYTIDRMMIDGVERAPLLNDYERWRRVVIQSPTAIQFQRMNDTFAGFPAKTDLQAKTMVLTAPVNPQAVQGNPAAAQNAPTDEIGRFSIEQPAPDKLILDGTVNGKKLRMETTYFGPRGWRLYDSKFHWVQDTPVNRSSTDYLTVR